MFIGDIVLQEESMESILNSLSLMLTYFMLHIYQLWNLQ
jgi:hypothetical protein